MYQSKVVAVLLIASATAIGAPAMAAPVTPLSVAAKPQATNLVQAQFGGWGWRGGWGRGWRGGGWGWRGGGWGWRGGGWGWGPGAPFAGVAIGTALAAPYWGDAYAYDYPAYGYPAYGPAYSYAYAPVVTVAPVVTYRSFGWSGGPYWRRSFAWGW